MSLTWNGNILDRHGLRYRIRTRDAEDNGTATGLMLNRGLSFADIRARLGAHAAGGTRSLFVVRAGSAGDIEALVVTEGAVDALSLAQIDGCPARHAFLSTAGAPSRSQRELIDLTAGILPSVRTVVARDHDEAGERQAGTLRERLGVPPHVTVRRRRPPENTDWNDVVNAGTKG